MKHLEDYHDCKKCHGKIVCISINQLGVTKCSYCNQVVDYTDYFKYREAKRVIDELKKQEIQNETNNRKPMS